MSKIYQHYAGWESIVVKCTCGTWSGKISEASRESHRDLVDFHCPVCDEIIAIIEDPTEGETREAAANGNPDALAALPTWDWIRKRNTKAYEMALRTPDQLPDIEGNGLCFTWDSMREEGEDYAEILYGTRILWLELEFWEGWERFNQVKNVLKTKTDGEEHIVSLRGLLLRIREDRILLKTTLVLESNQRAMKPILAYQELKPTCYKVLDFKAGRRDDVQEPFERQLAVLDERMTSR